MIWPEWVAALSRRPAFRALSLGVVLAMLAGPGAAHAGGPGSPFAIIANKDVETTALSRSAARAIFGMRLHAWENGEAVRVYVLPDDDEQQTRFAKGCLSIFPHQLRRIWDRLVFSGTGQAPNVVEDSQNMLREVAANAGAIGFLPREMLDDTVRVLELR